MNVDYGAIKKLVDKGDRFGLKRAETTLLADLQKHFRLGWDVRELTETYFWLARIEWRRKNHVRCEHYMRCLIVLLQNSVDIIRCKLGLAYVCVELGRFTEAQDLVVEANELLSAESILQLRDEVRRDSNDIFSRITQQRCK